MKNGKDGENALNLSLSYRIQKNKKKHGFTVYLSPDTIRIALYYSHVGVSNNVSDPLLICGRYSGIMQRLLMSRHATNPCCPIITILQFHSSSLRSFNETSDSSEFR